MADDPLHVLEIRGDDPQRPVTITAAVTAAAGHAIFVGLSEQLDRRRAQQLTSADDVVLLRSRIELSERFAPLERAGAHAIVQLTEDELRDCLLELTAYRERVDGDHYLTPDLRERLAVIAQIAPVLWDANATVAAVRDDLLSRTGGPARDGDGDADRE